MIKIHEEKAVIASKQRDRSNHMVTPICHEITTSVQKKICFSVLSRNAHFCLNLCGTFSVYDKRATS